jgi:hypothetical protein
MTQASLLSGVVANKGAEFEVSHPTNLEPVIVSSGISKGQLRSAAGAVPFADGPGIDRGGVEWNGQCYRVMGTRLVRVLASGIVEDLGDVGGDGPVALDYSFDRLIIRSGTSIWYYTGSGAPSAITDPDLGPVVDSMWIGGYTMATDGKYIIITELNDPFSVKPLKYGSAESDPDNITGLIRVGVEAYVLGRDTIQVFQNVGGTGFPFANVPGAVINTGCISATAKTLFGNTFAFVGSARGDALGVFVAGSGTANKISTRVVDDALSAQLDPAAIQLERRVSRDELRLLVHLQDETWVFMAKASEAAGEPVWYRLQSGYDQPYRIRNAVMVYGKTLVGDTQSNAVGELSSDVSTHFGEPAQWQFDVGFLYNQGKGAIINSVELTGLPGRGPGGVAFMSITQDGQTWSQERALTMRIGQRGQRLQWRPRARMRSYAGLRFRGYDEALVGFAACEVDARALRV